MVLVKLLISDEILSKIKSFYLNRFTSQSNFKNQNYYQKKFVHCLTNILGKISHNHFENSVLRKNALKVLGADYSK